MTILKQQSIILQVERLLKGLGQLTLFLEVNLPANLHSGQSYEPYELYLEPYRSLFHFQVYCRLTVIRKY